MCLFHVIRVHVRIRELVQIQLIFPSTSVIVHQNTLEKLVIQRFRVNISETVVKTIPLASTLRTSVLIFVIVMRNLQESFAKHRSLVLRILVKTQACAKILRISASFYVNALNTSLEKFVKSQFLAVQIHVFSILHVQITTTLPIIAVIVSKIFTVKTVILYQHATNMNHVKTMGFALI